MSRLRSIVTLNLAVLVLIASVGVTVNAHICGGQVHSTALFIKAKPCGMMSLAAHARKVREHKCCDDQTRVFKTSEDNAETVPVIAVCPISHAIALILPFIDFTFNATDKEIALPSLAYAKPPLPERDIIVLVHSLLI